MAAVGGAVKRGVSLKGRRGWLASERGRAVEGCAEGRGAVFLPRPSGRLSPDAEPPSTPSERL
eukprot:4926234-Prymnesium_polylepis.1